MSTEIKQFELKDEADRITDIVDTIIPPLDTITNFLDLFEIYQRVSGIPYLLDKVEKFKREEGRDKLLLQNRYVRRWSAEYEDPFVEKARNFLPPDSPRKDVFILSGYMGVLVLMREIFRTDLHKTPFPQYLDAIGGYILPTRPEDEQAAWICDVLGRFNKLKEETDRNRLYECVKETLPSGRLHVFLFNCLSLDTSQLWSESPESYILTDTAGNNVRGWIEKVVTIAQVIGKYGLRLQVLVVIGDTDQDTYIDPVVGLPSVNGQKVNMYKEEYRRNLVNQLQKYCKDAPIDLTVILWNSIDPGIAYYNEKISQEMVEEEAQRIRENWEANNWYPGIPLPDDETFRKIAYGKICMYAMQGKTITNIFQGMILLQNEFPPVFRTNMLNAYLQRNPIPAIYLFRS